jgi:hypothetical protein
VVDVADELLQEGLGGTELAKASGPVERPLQRRPRATDRRIEKLALYCCRDLVDEPRPEFR